MTNNSRSLDCPGPRSPTPNGHSPFRRLVLWTPSLPQQVKILLLTTVRAICQLDLSFFRLRFDRLTGREKDFFLPCFAVVGILQHPGDIAEQNGRQNKRHRRPRRSTLIDKGMIYSPSQGENIFTVSLFDGFLKRQLAIS